MHTSIYIYVFIYTVYFYLYIHVGSRAQDLGRGLGLGASGIESVGDETSSIPKLCPYRDFCRHSSELKSRSYDKTGFVWWSLQNPSTPNSAYFGPKSCVQEPL